MTFSPPPFALNTAQATLALRAIANVLKNPLYGTPFEHWQAQHSSDANLNGRGMPDYLANNPGEFASGVVYIANPQNPLRGVFCPAPRKPVQEVGGIIYQAEMQLYALQDLGECYRLLDNRVKLQDKFTILGRNYYAVSPAFPCLQGETVMAWKIDLASQRYPVQ